MEKILMKGLLILILCGGPGFMLQAQKKESPPLASNNTSLTRSRVKTPDSSGKKILVLYKTAFKGTLSGNKCAEDLTRKMGFRYEQLLKEGPGSKTRTGIFLHNLGAQTILLFKNGPFWQHRLKKRLKECREKTGDFAG